MFHLWSINLSPGMLINVSLEIERLAFLGNIYINKIRSCWSFEGGGMIYLLRDDFYWVELLNRKYHRRVKFQISCWIHLRMNIVRKFSAFLIQTTSCHCAKKATHFHRSKLLTSKLVSSKRYIIFSLSKISNSA